MIKNIAKLLCAALFTAALFASGGTAAADRRPGDADMVPADSALTTKHWKQARAYQDAMRLELARQEYLLALSSARTSDTVNRIQRELQIIDMQIRTLR